MRSIFVKATAALAVSAAACVAIAATPTSPGARHADPAAESGRALGALVTARLREGGSFFTPAERVRIEAMCGYRPGEWDGFQVDDIDGVFHCTNGRTVDSPEMHAILRTAEPRIRARVRDVMASAEVKAAIARIVSESTARALADVGREGGRAR